ncbi:unnamed protein product [Staurois parvus]|uniref:Uncharacterized protein n=1 Tax=Staurois parvus TaxID=386267 RepID=A0ABN9BTX1_9NEOB|nr:unnamed protein product [Staurois parvus]
MLTPSCPVPLVLYSVHYYHCISATSDASVPPSQHQLAPDCQPHYKLLITVII